MYAKGLQCSIRPFLPVVTITVTTKLHHSRTAHEREAIMRREELVWQQGRATFAGETQFSGPFQATWLPLHRHLNDVTHTPPPPPPPPLFTMSTRDVGQDLFGTPGRQS